MPALVSVRYRCPRCEAPNQTPDLGVGSRLGCLSCGWSREVTAADLSDHAPGRCLVCGTEDLWRQKNFPQALGLAFVAVGAVGSSIAWYYHRPVVALGVLLAVAAIDFGLFAVMPDVLVCYRCGAHYSGGEISEHPTFNHETAERYRQEKLRRETTASTPSTKSE